MSNKLQTFQWTGINKQGARLKGAVQGLDTKDAETELKTMGIEIISIEVKNTHSFFLKRQKKIKNKDMILFTRYLSTMLAAGMPILKTLEIISKDQDNPTMKSMVMSLYRNISSGMTFSDSISQFPEYFDELYCSLVRAGEKSATLEKVLSRLVKYMEKMARIKGKIKAALIYPITIILITVFVSLVLLLFVVPQFETMFKNAGVQLPIFTRIVLHASSFVQNFWWLLAALVFGAIFGIRYLKHNNKYFSEQYDKWILRIYIIGPIIRKSIVARFTRTLAITLEAGLPIVESMKSMVQIMGNKVYSNAIMQVSEDLIGGNQLATSIDSTHLFPGMMIQMIAVGEASGSLGDMLNHVASYYEEEVDTIADNLSALIEPLIIVILGVVIGCFVVAMYLPIFKLGSTI